MAVPSAQGYHGHFACRDFTGGGSFRARCNFGIARPRLRWRELTEHNKTKIYLKYFGVTRRGLKRWEFHSMIDRDASLKFQHNKERLKFRENKLNVYQKNTMCTSTHTTHSQTPFRLVKYTCIARMKFGNQIMNKYHIIACKL